MAPRETKNNAYAKFWSDKQRALWYVMVFSVVVNFVPCCTGKKKQIPNIGYFRVFKEYPQKSQIWKSEINPNQEISNQVPWLGLVSLFQIWDFCGYSLNTIKYPKMGI